MTESSSSVGPIQSPITVLAFDTSTASLAAAIVRDGVIAASTQTMAERNHSVRIVPEIKRLMEECGVRPDDINAIAVGQGPGSYTGVRIAVSVGKTLAWSWNKTLLGISSLEALAFGAWESKEMTGNERASAFVWIVPVMDARRGQVYTSRIAADGTGRWERMDADGIRMAADWFHTLINEAAVAEGLASIWFVGETAVHEHVWSAATGEGVLVRVLPFSMEAGAVGRLGQIGLLRGEKDDIHSFVPNYTQMTEAEAKLQAAARRD